MLSFSRSHYATKFSIALFEQYNSRLFTLVNFQLRLNLKSAMSTLVNRSNRIRAVILDMGGVMITAPRIAWANYERKHGLKQDSIRELLISPSMIGYLEKMDRGEISVDEFEELFTKVYSNKTGSNMRCLDFINDYDVMAKQVPIMQNLIRSLKTNGYKTALLTNNFFIDGSKTRSVLPLDTAPFDVIVESCRVGIRKPDVAIYQLVLEKLQCRPEEAVFLDDLGQNVKAARAFGMKTIKVLPLDPQKAIEELEELIQIPLMTPAQVIPVRKGMEIDTDQLAGYLNERFGTGTALDVKQYKHGQSNPTYFLRAGDRRFVLRKKPAGKLLTSAHMVEREYKVMKAIAQHGVPVPTVLDLCEDVSIIGTPFYLMDVVDGRIFTDPLLKDHTPRQRREIYTAMNETLCKIHSVNIDQAGLADFGKRENYIQRQLDRWSKQYEASKTDDMPLMDSLIQWLKWNTPVSQQSALVHGDFRLDNLIYHPFRNDVLAVIDWELSTLGDPLTDLATCCFTYYLPSTFPILQGLSDRADELPSLGIPRLDEFVNQYARRMNIEISPKIWNFYVAFVAFRFAAILQGVYKRSLQGQASGANASKANELVKFFVKLGWKQCQGVDENLARKMYSVNIEKKTDIGLFPTVPSAMSKRAFELYQKVKLFIKEEIIPLERELIEYAQGQQKWIPNPTLEKLKEKAKAQNLWNLFIPLHLDPKVKYGAGLTNVEYAHICELMGKNLFAPEVFNCSAPDTGNMEVLIKYGNNEQQAKWLIPLLDGKIRSCFAMTEPAVASSDATNIQSSIKRDGEYYVLNGRKWFISGAMDPRCHVCIFMGKTDQTALRHKQQSMIIVPMNTPGIKILRHLSAMGFVDAPGGHAEIEFDNVHVPVSNLILGEGCGFEIAQGRLGPGRIHHCMRLIGHSEYALRLMTKRALDRKAFGKRLAEHETVAVDIAQSRIEIEQARLLILKTAHMMDTIGNKAAAREVAMIKVVTPRMAMEVLDRAIQVHGAMGVSNDTMLSMMYVWARALRLADGPDEVHLAAVAKHEIKSNL